MPGTVKSELLSDADRSHKYDSQEKVCWIRHLSLDKSHFITGEKIESGYSMKMRDIHKWCLSQNIYYKTAFRYRKDYPISANMWNFYSYCRFMLEKHWIIIK